MPPYGSLCGYGYVDLCRNQQTEIDLLKTAIVHNAMAALEMMDFDGKDSVRKKIEESISAY